MPQNVPFTWVSPSMTPGQHPSMKCDHLPLFPKFVHVWTLSSPDVSRFYGWTIELTTWLMTNIPSTIQKHFKVPNIWVALMRLKVPCLLWDICDGNQFSLFHPLSTVCLVLGYSKELGVSALLNYNNSTITIVCRTILLKHREACFVSNARSVNHDNIRSSPMKNILSTT